MSKKPDTKNAEDLEDAEDAYKRVEARALALSEDQFTTLNVDVVSATSIILGVVTGILAYRDEMAKLPRFDMKNVDDLVDYAKGAWYVAVTNLPEAEPKDFQAMLEEATTLRAHFLSWAAPLARAQKFDQAALDAIKEGAGTKDTASDVVALVTLYRSKWEEVRSVCGVTEADLDRGAVLGPALFAAVSRRENKTTPSLRGGSIKLRRFWTLADHAYDQCQRAIAYFEWGQADFSKIAPTLRRSSRSRSSAATKTTTMPAAAPPVNSASPATAAAPVVTAEPQPGGNGSPFAR